MTSDQRADLDRGRSHDPTRIGVGGAAAIAVVGAAGIGVACALTPAAVTGGPELCPFRRLTGLPCPGCGLTRSWVFLMHGDVSSAFSFNAFGPLLLAITAVGVVLGAWALITGNTSGLERLRASTFGRVGIVLVVVWLLYGIARMADAGLGWGIFPSVT